MNISAEGFIGHVKAFTYHRRELGTLKRTMTVFVSTCVGGITLSKYFQ